MAGVDERIGGRHLGDRISDLPGGLRDCILERMPLKDAVRTSTLSTRWRYSWTNMRQIVLDEAFGSSMRDLTELKFAVIIDRLLLPHNGHIHKFVLHMPRSLQSRLLDLGVYLLILSNKRVQELTIDAFVAGGDRLYISSHIFSCLALTHLTLRFGELRPPVWSKGFPNLVSLELQHLVVMSDALGMLISQSPHLRTLKLVFTTSAYNDHPLVINGPSLVILIVKINKSGNLLIRNVPNLIYASILTFPCTEVEYSGVHGTYKLLTALSGVEEFLFDFRLIEESIADIPRTLPRVFYNLHTLTIKLLTVWNPKHVSFAFGLMRNAPNLETATIGLAHYRINREIVASAKYPQVEGREENTLSKLVSVRIKHIDGAKHELKLIKSMLACCPVLETLDVKLRDYVEFEEERKISREVMLFHRSSSKAEVIFSRPKKIHPVY